ncbi:FAD:protein FMN transferase [Aquabacterium sp. OR-4]|uniref:FAD:protein FMN transferase n=1 Tax=Aquabacterium sp. OR-4 TaxID=2978127 RepID=UPI0028C628F2|nr:FAD:protein FMN transferase [Aquabacterium sp. OR-4]MDT7836657.1 FAD:protein FMN transferase [Aquabacterium sp. OR-4]
MNPSTHAPIHPPATAAAARQVLLPALIEGEPPPWGQPCHRLAGASMGTHWSALFHAPPSVPLARVRQALQAELDRVDTEMSTWRPDSALMRFNRAPAGSRHVLPLAFAQVLDAALRVARASGGAFDPCAGALVGHWGFGPGADGRTPAYQATGFQPPLQAETADALHPPPARGQAAWDALAWSADTAQITQPGGICLDLCAIAKGHAVDRLSRCLAALGCTHHLVDVGGELSGQGLRPSGLPWWVDLEPPEPGLDPRHLPWAATRLALHGLAVATSGDYRRHYTDARGRRCSHTLDPRRGEPIRHGVASVSVLHPQALWADGWSTALLVLGPEAGLALARCQGLAARWLQRPATPGAGWRCVESPAWQALRDSADR